MWRTGPIKFQEDINLREEFQLKRLNHAEYALKWKQKRLLKRYGTKMRAFMDGAIVPFGNTKGKHFVDMCKNLVEPDDEYERIWKSYLLTLEEEKRLEEIHRAQLAQQNEQQLQTLFFGDVINVSEDISPNNLLDHNDHNEDHTKKCPTCRGAGYDCPKCDGRGWIELG